MIYESFSSATYYRFKSGAQHQKINEVYPASSAIYQNKLGRATVPTNGTPARIKPNSIDMIGHTVKTAWSNSLYSKLVQEIHQNRSEMLTNGVEWKTSLDMISGRVRAIHGAYLAVRRFRFKEAAKILSIQTPSKFKNLSRKSAKRQKLSPTAAWLEYWMGWAPMTADIANAVNALRSGPPVTSRHFSVGVSIDDKIVNRILGSAGNQTNITVTYTKKGGYAAYGEVIITNHNVNLANKMGLVNPLLTAYQVVPMSFIVDWFINVGQILGSLTDFVGLAFKDTGTALSYSTTATQRGKYGIGTAPAVDSSQDGFAWIRMRFPGVLPTPRLQIAMLDRLSLTRAATSVSLLVEVFLRKN